MAPLAVVVRNDDEAASLLDDGGGGGGGSPVLLAGVSRRPPPPPPSPPPLHGRATRNAVMRCIRSPFAAVLRMTTCKRADDAISPSGERPSRNTAARAAVAERCREAQRRRPSLEQLLRMEAAPPPSPSRPDRKSKRDTTTQPSEVVATCAAAVKEKRAREPLSPYKIHSRVAVVSDDDERHAAAAPDAVKLDACGGRRTSAERLVVVFASLRACSRAPGISVVRTPKGPSGKVAAAGRAPGKAELFYYRPIPMGRRCRVQHLEESIYK